MSTGRESEVLSMLQPDLLTEKELIQKIRSRCCRIENLELMSKEGLVGLFRRVILPLPQRFYRTNRRGKMLTSRRAKAGLESKKKEEGFAGIRPGPGASSSGDRLKPPPDVSRHQKIRITSDGLCQKIRLTATEDRRKSDADEDRRDSSTLRPECPSGRKITLKRPSGDEASSPRTDGKKRRTAIEWP